MANICTTTYHFNGPKAVVQKLYDEISEVMETPDKYVGDLTERHNVSSSDTRGWFLYIEQDIEYTDNTASFSTAVESKWNRCGALDELFFRSDDTKDINVLFLEMEPLCGIHVTNDTRHEVWGPYVYQDCENELTLNAPEIIDRILNKPAFDICRIPEGRTLKEALALAAEYNRQHLQDNGTYDDRISIFKLDYTNLKHIRTETATIPSTEALRHWFAEQDFITLEKISGLRERNYDPEDGSQAFVDACGQWWESLTYEEQANIFNNYARGL